PDHYPFKTLFNGVIAFDTKGFGVIVSDHVIPSLFLYIRNLRSLVPMLLISRLGAQKGQYLVILDLRPFLAGVSLKGIPHMVGKKLDAIKREAQYDLFGS